SPCQPPVPQPHDAVAVGCVRLRMVHLDNGRSLAVQLAEEPHDLRSLLGVQVARRLVREQEPRLRDHRRHLTTMAPSASNAAANACAAASATSNDASAIIPASLQAAEVPVSSTMRPSKSETVRVA